MKSLKSPTTVFVALCILAFSLVGASAYNFNFQHVNDCIGQERWIVKTLQDKEVYKINFTPKKISIEDILKKKRSTKWKKAKNNPRLIDEFQVYTVIGNIPFVKLEADGDIHIELVDVENPNLTLIAEIPNPDCTITEKSNYKKMFRKTRNDFIKHNYLDETVHSHGTFEITGVLFHDSRNHGNGGNQEGIELHPAILIRKIK